LREDSILMDKEDRRRLHMIQQVIEKKATQQEAAEVLKLSDRQIRRLVKRVRKEGDSGVIHRARGKNSNQKFAGAIRKRVLDLYKERYSGFGPTLATEKLLELNGIEISDETMRCWLIEEELPYKRRKGRPHRQWRERKEHAGQMIQMDGSHHDWLEGRGPKLVLMACIDDASSRIYARFYDYEGTIPALDLLKGYVKKYGIPQSVYLDRHTTYKSNGKLSIEDELSGKDPFRSHFERAMRELAVAVIHANSPQAKGRIERLFRTFQDRVIKEMRLRSIGTKQEANRFLGWYLPGFNKKFHIVAAKEGDWHRPVSNEVELDSVLSIKTERFLRNDFTIAHDGKLFQILDQVRARTLTVEERTNGSLVIRHKGKMLKHREIRRQPKPGSHQESFSLRRKKPLVPAPDHPWRKFKLPGSKSDQGELKIGQQGVLGRKNGL
jgi:transposase